MQRLTTRALTACTATLAVLAACDPNDAPCVRLCADIARCEAVCDPEGGPGCDTETKYREAKDRCLEECKLGAATRGETCVATHEAYAACVTRHGCVEQVTGACDDDWQRYFERCIGQPGDLSCFHFCAALDVGCLPYDEVGFRGDGCARACLDAAAELSCADAHHAVQQCMARAGGLGFACQPFASSCTSELEQLRAVCPTWQQVDTDPEEVALCANAAARQCACGLWFEPDVATCNTLAHARCLYTLGLGDTCAASIGDFDTCLASLATCTRADAQRSCTDTWEAWVLACDPAP